MQTKILKRIEQVKMSLMLDYIFWGVIATRLKFINDENCKTCYTDSKVLGYNGSFYESLTDAELLFVIAHEILHVALGHCFRAIGKNLQIWNEACDYVVNILLVDLGFKMPQDALFEEKFRGMNADEVYFLLMKDENKGGHKGQHNSTAKDSSSSTSAQNNLGEKSDNLERKCKRGELRPCDDSVHEREIKQITLEAAQQALRKSNLPGSLKRVVKDVLAPEVDWKNLTTIFFQQISPTDYAWSRPNPCYLQRGMYVPSLSETRLGKLIFGNDTSGSISNYQQSCAQEFVRQLMNDLRPASLTVMHCDSRISNIEVFEEYDLPIINPVGSGGTDFRPVFTEIAKMDEIPSGLIYLTDLEGTFPTEAPEYPVLWLSTKRNATPPFGEAVYLDLRKE